MSTDRLGAMEIFVRVVDAGSFSAAAAQLGIGQPAVSKTIAQLEERLGVKLLLRSTRSSSLTEAGKTFYANAAQAIEKVNQAERLVRGDGALSGTLRVSASVCFSRLHLMPRLAEILAQHPEMDIEVVTDDRFVNLVEEGVDVALRTGTLADSSLTVRKLGQARRRVMATRTFFEKHGRPTTPDDLVAAECVVLQREGRTFDHWSFRRGGLERAVRIGGRLKVSSGEGLREAVLSGVGIAIVSEWLFSPELASGEVESVLDEWELPHQDLWAVFPPGKLVRPEARELVAFVERVMNAPFAPSPVVLRSVARR
ncbi:MAG: transcriptional regulator [Labilithrix sp.]|nr:transcriptional regulator [Labilithrix sp.]